MRADLKNYLIAKSQGIVGASNTQTSFNKTASSRFQSGGRITPNSILSPKMEGHIDLRNDRLTRNTPTRAYQVKPLHDSCYVVPHKNYRVIQDDDPVKNTAWREALQRHETNVNQEKNFNKTVMHNFYNKIASD